jgi:hypothetical protein
MAVLVAFFGHALIDDPTGHHYYSGEVGLVGSYVGKSSPQTPLLVGYTNFMADDKSESYPVAWSILPHGYPPHKHV